MDDETSRRVGDALPEASARSFERLHFGRVKIADYTTKTYVRINEVRKEKD
jgi:hypothetical protein